MIAVLSNLIKLYQEFLDKKTIPPRYQSYYQKWLRYYWDFCHKYHHPATHHESLRLFKNKLRQKKQKDFLIKQASDAVSIYYEVVRVKNVDGETNTIQHKTPIKNRHCPVYNTEHAQPLPVMEQHSTFRKDSPKYPRSPNSATAVSSEPAHCPSSKKISSPDPKKQVQKPPVLSGQKDCKIKHADVRTGKGASWEYAFNGLRDEIKVRHYSPKIFKSYHPIFTCLDPVIRDCHLMGIVA